MTQEKRQSRTTASQQRAANKRVATAFFTLLRDRSFSEALDLLDPEGDYWIGAGPPYETRSLKLFRAELRVIERGVNPTPLKFVIDNVVAEGDQVVVELHNEGVLADGQPYEMIYCFVFVIRDERIVSVRQYADTKYGVERHSWLTSKDTDVQREMAAVLQTVEAGGGDWPLLSSPDSPRETG
jgi:ketosteroid isomerase-like protein